jgi:membrane-associated protein
MPVEVLMAPLVVAALGGHNCNSCIGRALTARARHWEHSRLFNRKVFDRTEAFYARHGGKTIVLARFVPLVRTFAPFVAGVGRMPYARFLLFSVGGALLWVGSLVTAGYLFGNLPLVRDNFEIAVLSVVGISILPIIVEVVRHRRSLKAAA